MSPKPVPFFRDSIIYKAKRGRIHDPTAPQFNCYRPANNGACRGQYPDPGVNPMDEPTQTPPAPLSAFDEVDQKIHEAEETAQECEDLLDILENTP